jgi:hypothetical protein
MISPMRRTIATILLLSAAAALACACGSGRAASDAGARGATSTTTGPTASVGSGSRASPGSKVSAATLDLGEAINLRHSDLPAMRQVLAQGESSGISAARRKCGRAASLFEEPAGFHSPTLTQGAGPELEAVRSTVRLAPSAAAAAHRLSTNASASFLACFERFLQSRARHLSPKTTPAISVSALPFPLPGVSESLGFRITRVASHAVVERAPVYTDIFEFASGRVEVALSAVRASHPPSATERRLLSLLLGRAKANEI